MRKSLATLAWAAIPAVLIGLSACNGNSGTNAGMVPLPSSPAVAKHSRVRGDLSANLHAAGATFPAYGYNLGVQPVGTPGPGQPAPTAGSVLYGAEQTFSDGADVFYCLTGSTKGKAEFEGNQGALVEDPCAALGATFTGYGAEQDPLDFAGSDVALASTECCASGTTYYAGRLTGSQQWGQPFEFPTFGGPIVFGYIQNSFTGISKPLQLSTWTYCAIVNGTVGNWNDPAITADNGGASVTGGISEPINFYYRSDGSGTSYLFQYKLSNSKSGCNQTFKAPYNAAPYGSPSRVATWTAGYSTTWLGPTGEQASGSDFIGENGNPGILQAIQQDVTGFGTGYVEGAWAASTQGENPPVAQASIQNGFKSKGKANFVSPTNTTAVGDALKQVTAKSIAYGMGSDGNTLGSTKPGCQLYIPPANFVTPKTTKAYPIVGLSYWLFYGNNNGIHLADKTKLVQYIANTTQMAAVLQPLEYTPLSSAIGNKITAALKGHGKKSACLQ